MILGINGETLATQGASTAIATKILGIKAEQLEEEGLIGAINGMIIARQGETLATGEATAMNLGFTGGLTAMITGETIA